MASNGDTEEVFDEDELAEGFDEEIVGEDLDVEEIDEVADVDADEDDDEVDAVIETDDDEVVAVSPAVVEEEEEVDDDVDVELALDEVLAETIRRTTTPEDDDDVIGDIDISIEPGETILPKQVDEFRCSSCRLLKKTSQLADQARTLCRDCV